MMMGDVSESGGTLTLCFAFPCTGNGQESCQPAVEAGP